MRLRFHYAVFHITIREPQGDSTEPMEPNAQFDENGAFQVSKQHVLDTYIGQNCGLKYLAASTFDFCAFANIS